MACGPPRPRAPLRAARRQRRGRRGRGGPPRRRLARPPAARRRDGSRSIALSLAETASLPPLDRDVRSWRLDNGLEISERRVPVGTIGANFEARPNVAADVASQVLKSGNTVVLRTGGAALAHRDGAGRPRAAAGARGGRHPAGRGRPRADARTRGRRGARLLAAPDPARDPARERPVDGGARAPRGGARRADAGPRGGRRRALRPFGRRPGDGGSAGAGEPRPPRRLQPAQPCARRLARAGGGAAAALRGARPRGACHRARGRARRRGAARHAARPRVGQRPRPRRAP